MMILGSFLLVWVFGAQLSSIPPQSACLQALSADADAAAGEICLGEEAGRAAGVAPRASMERTHQLEAEAQHYRRAVDLSSTVETKVRVLDLLAQSYDADHLNDPMKGEQVLRELIRVIPDDLAPVYRLARLLENRGLIEAAEDTFLSARHQQPEAVEPYRMLAQFYARRVTSLHKEALAKEPHAETGPGERDENGVYRIGNSVTPPSRLDVPRYPPEASAAGIKGAVVAEVVIDTAGNVTAAKVVQSIPLLDEAALNAVHNWHYAPTVINGEPVPVKMNVTVNFTLPPTPPASPAPQRR